MNRYTAPKIGFGGRVLPAGGIDIKQYCTLHVFQKDDIDVMHSHDDKHTAWSESEISISVLIHSRFVVPRRNGAV